MAFLVALAASLLGSAVTVSSWAATATGDTYSFFTGADVSAVPVDSDTTSVELGLRFTASRDGDLTGVRFLKAGAADRHPVSVWSGSGVKLAATVSRGETGSGWQQVDLGTPVAIRAGQEYVVSYRTDRYRASERYFTRKVTAGPLSTVGTAGVYRYGAGGFPEQTYQASNYWVDVVFRPTAGRPTPSPTTRPVGLDLPRVPWEGGPGYYAGFPVARQGGWTDPAFFPTAVWFEGTYEQYDINLDSGAGLNTYVQLTRQSNLPLIGRNGMHAMVGPELANRGAETKGWVLADEPDMWAGPGNGTWTGNWPGEGEICTPRGSGCGHDVQRRLLAELPAGEGRMRYANYGKGVIFWQSDADAAAFVNGYTDIVSADIYWYTDPNVCTSASEGPTLGVRPENCRRAANYGLTMDRMRALDAADGKRQPVYAFVEVGHPFSEDDAPTITGNQIAGAVMNSLIHEARGIIYFNHNFGGPCHSQHVLRDCGMKTVRPKVTETNDRVKALAPVLNTQSYQWRFNQGLDTMLKAHDGSYYIFAMPGRDGGTGDQTLTLPPGLGGASAEVLFENRSVPISGGTLRDRFAEEYSYHIYKITP